MKALLLLLLAAPLAAQVSYSPQPINFGSVKLGATSATLTSTLTNTGPDTLRFCGGTPPPGCVGSSSMTGSSAFSYVTDNCTARAPGATCVLQYRFAPKSVGTLTGANIVQTNHGPFPLNFTGVGVDTVTVPPPNKPPVATFSVSCVQLVCTFTSTSVDPDGTIASSRWDFGDLATAATPVATHTFLSGGTFSVALTVTDNAGASSTLTQLVTVVSPVPPPLDTAFAWTLASRVHTRDSVCAHVTVTYAGPCGTMIPAGTKGSITGGPGRDAGWTFWLVRFDNAVTGWARQVLLALDTLGVPPPAIGPVNYISVAPQGIGAPADRNIAYYLSAIPFDSAGHALGTALTWSIADTSVAKFNIFGVASTQVVSVSLIKQGTTIVSAAAGGKVGNITLSVGAPLPPIVPPPSIITFGVQAAWVRQFLPGCQALPGTRCARALVPILNDSTGLVQAQMADTATFIVP